MIIIVFEICLNFLFLFVFKTGVEGLGYSTAVANILSVSILMYPVIKEAKKRNLKHYRPNFGVLKRYIKQSIPVAIRNISIWMVVLTQVNFVAELGAQYTSAMHICESILIIQMFTFDSLAGATQTIVSESNGAKTHSRTLKIMNRTVRFSRILLIPLIALLLTLSYFVPRLVTVDSSIHKITMIACIVLIFSIPITSYVFVNDGVFQAFQKYNYLAIATAISSIFATLFMFLIHKFLVAEPTVKFLIIYASFNFVFVLSRGIFTFLGLKKIQSNLYSNIQIDNAKA
jgi:Na+-driven multidrug efflux pump